ncbi:hypothetical protein D3C87_1873900 [compost metagenome]
MLVLVQSMRAWVQNQSDRLVKVRGEMSGVLLTDAVELRVFCAAGVTTDWGVVFTLEGGGDSLVIMGNEYLCLAGDALG